MLLCKPSLTAELIAHTADQLTSQLDINKPFSTTDEQATARVQVPMPDLRQFDRLLSESILPEGESDHECNDPRTPYDAAAALSQNPAIADDAQRVFQAQP
jgi:hypothetical protein